MPPKGSDLIFDHRHNAAMKRNGQERKPGPEVLRAAHSGA